MKLHEDQQLFRQAIRATSDHLNIREVYIEKDYWVTYALKLIFTNLIGSDVVFKGGTALSKCYGILPRFSEDIDLVIALSVSRTLCEKIMSLIRFSYSQQPIQDLSNKIGHIYDIHLLLKIDSLNNFFRSDEFEILLNKVAKDDKKSFKNDSDWISEHPTKALIFHDLDNVWFKIKESYSNDFRAMVYGDFPDEHEIYDTLKAVQSRLKFIEWSVNEEN